MRTIANAGVQVPAVAAAHNQQPQASAGGRPAALLRHGCRLAVQVRGGRCPEALALRGDLWRFACWLRHARRLQVSSNAHVLRQHCSRHVASARPPQLLHVHPAAGAASIRNVQVSRAVAQQQQRRRRRRWRALIVIVRWYAWTDFAQHAGGAAALHPAPSPPPVPSL